jgi:hypothetical protein
VAGERRSREHLEQLIDALDHDTLWDTFGVNDDIIVCLCDFVVWVQVANYTYLSPSQVTSLELIFMN